MLAAPRHASSGLLPWDVPQKERRSPTPAAHRKREAVRRLKQALAGDDLFLHYQPLADAATGRPVSVEALLRWSAERYEGELAQLICAAERSPLIFRLENWTLKQALGTAAAWESEPLASLRLNVNISARGFDRKELAARVLRQAEDAGFPARKLALEITETSALRDLDDVAPELAKLKAAGVERWLDDFGTGHSSLHWLSRLPLDGVKIPAAFVTQLPSDDRCRVIVRRVVELAHELGLRAAAEGVETEEQRAFLQECGCDLLQGYLLFAGMPAETLVRTLA
jgi:EAL domain-containing protein (putative c-di-GMP-specific phosphodiesterase class I)